MSDLIIPRPFFFFLTNPSELLDSELLEEEDEEEDEEDEEDFLRFFFALSDCEGESVGSSLRLIVCFFLAGSGQIMLSEWENTISFEGYIACSVTRHYRHTHSSLTKLPSTDEGSSTPNSLG